MSERVKNVYRMDDYKPKLWERILLPFHKMQTWRGIDTILSFKSMFGRMYIYDLAYYAKGDYDNSRGAYN